MKVKGMAYKTLRDGEAIVISGHSETLLEIG
jgi:hypothetical protein